MKKKTVCNCWFDSKHWKLGAHSVSLFSPWRPHHEAPSYPSRSLTSHLRVSRRDQAKPGPACLEGWRLHQPTYILRFTHGFLLGRTVNVARLPLPLHFSVSLFSPASSASPLVAKCWWRVIPVNSGVKALLTFDPMTLHSFGRRGLFVQADHARGRT